MKDLTRLAEQIRDAILKDLEGRQGVGDELGAIDASIRKELEEEHKKIILEILEKVL